MQWIVRPFPGHLRPLLLFRGSLELPNFRRERAVVRTLHLLQVQHAVMVMVVVQPGPITFWVIRSCGCSESGCAHNTRRSSRALKNKKRGCGLEIGALGLQNKSRRLPKTIAPKVIHRTGIEPVPLAWKASMIASSPSALVGSCGKKRAFWSRFSPLPLLLPFPPKTTHCRGVPPRLTSRCSGHSALGSPRLGSDRCPKRCHQRCRE